jgi:hypothetical protein
VCLFDDKVLTRFWSKVDVRGPNDCWPYKEYLSNGYGQFWAIGCSWRANRVALIRNGEDRPGLKALHSCDNPACCNPQHLRWGTTAENFADFRSRKPKQASFLHRKATLHARKLSVRLVGWVKWLLNDGQEAWRIARVLRVSRGQVGEIKRGITYRSDAAIKPSDEVILKCRSQRFHGENFYEAMRHRKLRPFDRKAPL